jgi:uncharacterized metal-binding protein
MAKIGIIACSGEELPVGTISRLATRRVLELLRPEATTTLCLPLFLAGEEQERRFAREHPTIAVDGCDRLCAKRGTEQYSGRVAASLVVSEILGDRAARCHRSARAFDKADEEAVGIVAERIAAEVDALAATEPQAEPAASPQGASCACSCGGGPPEGALPVHGKTIAVNALPLIFDRLHGRGLAPDDRCGDPLLEMVRIYHAIDPAEEPLYRDALAAAYREFCQSRARPQTDNPPK